MERIFVAQRSTGDAAVKSNFVWVSAGMAGMAAYRWLLVVMLARQGTPEVLGQYALAVSIATPLVVFSRMRLRSLQASQTRATYQFGHYAALTLVNSVLVLAAVFVISLAGGYDGNTSTAILLLTAGLVVESGSELCYGYFQQQERMQHIGRSMLLRAFLSGLFTWWALASGIGLVALLAGLGGVTGLMLAGYDLRWLNRLSQGARSIESGNGGKERLAAIWNVPVLRQLAVTAVPLACGGALAALNLNIPRYVLESTAGLEQLGIFSAMAALVVPGNVVMLGMTQAALPRLSRHFSSGRKPECRRLVWQLLLLSSVVGGGFFLLLAVAGEWLVSTLFTSAYAGRPVVLCVLAGAAAVTYVGYTLVVVVIAQQRFWTVVKIHSATSGVVLIGSLWLVGRYDILGAAVMQLAGAVCTTALLAVAVVSIMLEFQSSAVPDVGAEARAVAWNSPSPLLDVRRVE